MTVPEAPDDRVLTLAVIRRSGRPWSCRVLQPETIGGRTLARCLIFLPDDCEAFRLSETERGAGAAMPSRLELRRLPRMRALALILWRRPETLRPAWRDARRGHFKGWCQRLRADTSVAAEIAFHPRAYAAWIDRFDRWDGARRSRLMASPARPRWPRIDAVVFDGLTASAAAMATRASLSRQWWPACRILAGTDLDAAAAEYVAILQAGEIAPPHALALLADRAALDRPPILMADEDRIGATGHRARPLFKPNPNHALMLSGTMCSGLWLVRRDVLSDATRPARHADVLRLEVWLAAWRRSGTRGQVVPFVLTHRRADAEAAAPEDLAAVVARHAARAQIPLRVTPSWPLDVQPLADPGREREVAVVIASRCRAPLALDCIRAVARRTSCAIAEIVLVLAQPDPPDADQARFIASIGGTVPVRALHVPMDKFNYAAANNAGVRATMAPLVLLLNDDVAPRRADWLDRMVGHMSDTDVGIVGAKLIYPNETVQHCGVIMGLGGIAEHAGRLMAHDQPGPTGLLTLDREVSAVTGACLLTRRRVFDAVAGLDESFAAAFNDVDYCLRARALGWGVVLAAKSPLVHYESLSFGSHYGEADTPHQRADDVRMRSRWAAWIDQDPFHSPNLTLYRTADSDPAFPPRVATHAHPLGPHHQVARSECERRADTLILKARAAV